MRRIRCIDLITYFDVLPMRMVEVVLYRECHQALVSLAAKFGNEDADRWKKEVVPRLLYVAGAALKEPLHSNATVTELEAAEVYRVIAGAPNLKELVNHVLGILDVEFLRRVEREARQRIRWRSTLPWCELKMALVPFTDSCAPEPADARECWCGYWIKDGVSSCPFCGDVSPQGRASRVWERKPCLDQQLEPLLEQRLALEQNFETRAEDIRIPQGSDPGRYISAMESIDYQDSEVPYESTE